MTLHELAKIAGVSVGTVSKAFHHSDEISEVTRERIFALAQEYGCYYKYCRDKHEKKVVAVICHEIKSEHYACMIEYIQARMARAHIEVMISFDDFDAQKQQHLISLYAGQMKVDGILVIGLQQEISKGIEVPVVAIGVAPQVSHGDAIRLPVDKPLTEAVRYLRELGHRDIAFIGEPLVRRKLRIMEQILRKYEMPCGDLIEVPERFEAAGRQGVQLLLERKSKATAVICGYDNIAFGAIAALTERGIRVPEDMSVIGMNNIPACEQLNRSLTSISEGSQAVCDMACDLLMRKMENRFYCSGTQIEIAGTLIIRATTAVRKWADT